MYQLSNCLKSSTCPYVPVMSYYMFSHIPHDLIVVGRIHLFWFWSFHWIFDSHFWRRFPGLLSQQEWPASYYFKTLIIQLEFPCKTLWHNYVKQRLQQLQTLQCNTTVYTNLYIYTWNTVEIQCEHSPRAALYAAETYFPPLFKLMERGPLKLDCSSLTKALLTIWIEKDNRESNETTSKLPLYLSRLNCCVFFPRHSKAKIAFKRSNQIVLAPRGAQQTRLLVIDSSAGLHLFRPGSLWWSNVASHTNQHKLIKMRGVQSRTKLYPRGWETIILHNLN